MHGRSEAEGDGSAGVDAYYDLLASWLDRSLEGRGDTAWWRERVRASAPGPVVELGCGTGRVTAVIAETGRRVIGLDRSDAMLARARNRLGERSGVRLIRGDLRDLPLRDASIACAVAPNDPFIHLTTDVERQRAIDEAARILSPSGVLLLELLWWTPRERELARSASGLARTSETVGADGETVQVDERWSESAEGHVRGTYRYFVRGELAAEASFRGRRWTRDELQRRLRRARLDGVHSWGGFDGRPFEPDDARALLVLAVRAAG